MNDRHTNSDMVKVKIHGQEYPIKANGNNAEYIRKVASYVDEIITKIKQENSENSLSRLAILAALNITDELFSIISEKEKLVKIYEEKTRNISESLNSGLIDD